MGLRVPLESFAFTESVDKDEEGEWVSLSSRTLPLGGLVLLPHGTPTARLLTARVAAEGLAMPPILSLEPGDSPQASSLPLMQQNGSNVQDL